MNKTKRQLYEENKKLKKEKNIYNEFWETDAIEECDKQMKFTKYSIMAISIVLLIITSFLIGLCW